MSKTLLITGASRGIGLASVDAFMAAGYAVVNLSRSPCPRDGVRQVSVDFADPDWAISAMGLIEEALAQATSLVVIHNAAVLTKDAVQSVTAKEIRLAFEINVVAPTILNRIVEQKLTSGSSILYVGSTLGSKAVSNTCSYSVTKHALLGLMRATCQDFAGRGVHTAIVCPGFTDTEMLRNHVGGSEDVLADIATGVTMGRLIDPKEIADTLLFCAQSPVLNGAEIHANLGQVEH